MTDKRVSSDWPLLFLARTDCLLASQPASYRFWQARRAKQPTTNRQEAGRAKSSALPTGAAKAAFSASDLGELEG